MADDSATSATSGDESPSDLARRLAETVPEVELSGVIHELRARTTRVRADRYEEALARAHTARERGDLETALREVQAALRIDFVRWEAHRALGEIQEAAGDRHSALQSYVTALHLGWESAEAAAAARRVS